MTMLLLALVMGVVAGLRTFTAPAVFFLTIARAGVAGYILGVFAIGEYIVDALPKTPARTGLPAVTIRSLSGAITGWFMAGTGGAIAGIIGALIGTYGGYSGRMAAIAKIGAVPAAVVEDVIAIAIAAVVMMRYVAAG